jgi:hypothetical protein
VDTVGRLRGEHPGSRVIVAGDRNDLAVEVITNMDPTLKQLVKDYTNKKGDKVLDVILTDSHNIMQEPTILPPLQVDDDKTGKDSDHKGVQCLPRSNIAPHGGPVRTRISVQRFPESKIAQFGIVLGREDWSELGDNMNVNELVDSFQVQSKRLVDKFFPTKDVLVGPQEKPYFSEELRQLRRRRQRAYDKHGRRSIKYARLRQSFDLKLEHEARKYVMKLQKEVKEGTRESAYKAIRKLGNRPGESWNRPEVSLTSYIELSLSPKEEANKLADYFSAISQTVEPLDRSQFHPALKLALAASGPKPVLTQHEVYRKIMRVSKPNSAVPCDVPKILMKNYAFLYAAPVTKIINKMIQTGDWPRLWVNEETIVLSKLDKAKTPACEDDLRTISKTPWLSKLSESVLGDYILPVIESFLDPGQCGGLRKTSINHYLVKLLDFIHSTLDKRNPHAAVMSTQDQSKAYNRGSHQLVIEDLFAMMHGSPHVGWVLNLTCSYLSGRSMVLTYRQARSGEKSLPGGFSAGTFLGGLLYIIKFNGACLRPPVPRPLTGNRGIQLKYVDDSSQAASVNLKRSLEQDPTPRPRPFNYHERNETRIKESENILSQELTKFQDFCTRNKLIVNGKKSFVMLFNRSRTLAFPPEFQIGNSGILQVKKTLRILGVLVQDDLGWRSQVNEMVKRASKTIWVLRRMKALGVDQPTLTEYWKSEGRVHLEMACPVWHSGLTTGQSRDLDRAQRMAMAAITGRWEPSHSGQLRQLGLEALAPRRVRISRTFAERTAKDSRHMDLFVPSGARPRKGKIVKTYREQVSRTATHFNSALPYLTRLLNSD